MAALTAPTLKREDSCFSGQSTSTSTSLNSRLSCGTKFSGCKVHSSLFSAAWCPSHRFPRTADKPIYDPTASDRALKSCASLKRNNHKSTPYESISAGSIRSSLPRAKILQTENRTWRLAQDSAHIGTQSSQEALHAASSDHNQLGLAGQSRLLDHRPNAAILDGNWKLSFCLPFQD